MALQSFANTRGILLSPAETFELRNSGGDMTCDAVGESAALIGHLNLSGGPGSSATLSSAGSGMIHVAIGALTFNNAATHVKIGVQDVGATGLDDGTFDVYADTVTGTGLAATSVNRVTMTSGTKTITHGDLIALVVEMTAKGGADAFTLKRASVACQVPYATNDVGSGIVKAGGLLPLIAIEFDDGTLGWMDNAVPHIPGTTQTVFNSGSTPDEYALVFKLPCAAVATGLWSDPSAVTTTDDFEMILYSDPLGTPVAERTIVQDADLLGADTAGVWSRSFTSAYTLLPNTYYGIAIRPTTANSLGFLYYGLGTNGANLRKATMLGTNWSQYSRTNQTGAFASEDTTRLPYFGLWLSAFSDNGFVGIIGSS